MPDYHKLQPYQMPRVISPMRTAEHQSQARLRQAVQAASRHKGPHQCLKSQPEFSVGKIASLKGGIWLSAYCGPQTEQVILVLRCKHEYRLSQLPPALVFDLKGKSPDNTIYSVCRG